MKAKIDLVGKRFGKLVALELAEINRHRQAKWKCKCDCGRTTITLRTALTQGRTRSCGCLWRAKISKGNPKHGYAGTSIYQLWGSMIERCTNPKSTSFENYGGRGITVCKRWKSFVNFFADMGEKPAGRMLERKNNDGDYSPDNCVWVTRSEQNRNTRRTRRFEIGGVVKCLTDWASEFGINRETLSSRIKRGIPFEKALTEPARR